MHPARRVASASAVRATKPQLMHAPLVPSCGPHQSASAGPSRGRVVDGRTCVPNANWIRDRMPPGRKRITTAHTDDAMGTAASRSKVHFDSTVEICSAVPANLRVHSEAAWSAAASAPEALAQGARRAARVRACLAQQLVLMAPSVSPLAAFPAP